jgi:SAM-dependent methyltransferase
MDEPERIKERYKRRKQTGADAVRNPVAGELARKEREYALRRLIEVAQLAPIEHKSLIEIGCGGGSSLNELFELGFSPNNTVAVELVPEHVLRARHNLPAGVQVIEGNALEVDLSARTFDIVFQSTVFTSILDADFQRRLADRMWDLTKPGGGILWCDFIYNNPWNPDVKGVPLRRVRALFPHGRLLCWRIMLLPPLSRLVTRIHPCLYNWFNAFPVLRSHVLCWIERQ